MNGIKRKTMGRDVALSHEKGGKSDHGNRNTGGNTASGSRLQKRAHVKKLHTHTVVKNNVEGTQRKKQQTNEEGTGNLKCS
jgi:hypothetical protein